MKDVNPGTNSSYPSGLFAYNGTLFFGADDGVSTSLWKSDGTKTGTVKVKNIEPDYTSRFTLNDVYCVSNNVLYLVARTPEYGYELWKTTGTSSSTKLVKDIIPLEARAPQLTR